MVVAMEFPTLETRMETRMVKNQNLIFIGLRLAKCLFV